jgi:thioredoxin reductase (NADPH)
VQLKEKNIDYYNSYGSFVDDHTILATDQHGNQKYLTSKYIVLAVGGRPSYPTEVVGADEFGITSDDLFFLKTPPGKTMVVGGSCILSLKSIKISLKLIILLLAVTRYQMSHWNVQDFWLD